MKNHFDKNGNYINVENLSLAEIYHRGYQDGSEDGLNGIRPHGKWIKIFENPFTNGYVCPFCGHKIQVTEQFLPEVTECEVCGAEMKGWRDVETPEASNNAELFEQTFGIYATEVWAMKESDFLKWLNAEVRGEDHD